MPIHIGKKIKEVFEKKGMTVSEFGRRIHKSRENVYSIFKRKTIDTGLLYMISLTLDHDLFNYYSEAGLNHGNDVDEREVKRLKEEIKLLKELNKLLKKSKRR